MEELERTVDDKQEAVRVVEKKSQNMVSATYIKEQEGGEGFQDPPLPPFSWTYIVEAR